MCCHNYFYLSSDGVGPGRKWFMPDPETSLLGLLWRLVCWNRKTILTLFASDPSTEQRTNQQGFKNINSKSSRKRSWCGLDLHPQYAVLCSMIWWFGPFAAHPSHFGWWWVGFLRGIFLVLSSSKTEKLMSLLKWSCNGWRNSNI